MGKDYSLNWPGRVTRVDKTRQVDEQTTKCRYETHVTSGTAYHAITQV